jgi:uncharacterized protein
MNLSQAMDQSGNGFYPSQVPVEGYGKGGFRFADMSHRGGLLALASGMKAWDVPSHPDEMKPEHFKAILNEAAELGFFLIGTGASMVMLPSAILNVLTSAGIRFEIASTSTAASTYNILLSEKRPVSAALLPVDAETSRSI